MDKLERFRKFENLYQVVSWLGTAGLLAVVFLGDARALAHRPILTLCAALIGIASMLFVNLLPIESGKGLRYGADDKVLVESLVMILLITAFLYFHPFMPAGFFLLLIPILIEATVLHERIISAEAAFAAVAIVFLRMADPAPSGLLDLAFLVELGIFVGVVCLMYFLTRELRLSAERNNDLSRHLSVRLDQIQVISMLVGQSEHFSRFEILLTRIGEIVSDAFDAEQCGFFLADGAGGLSLCEGSVGFGEHDKEVYRLGSNLETPRDVFRDGQPIAINDDQDAKRKGVVGLIGDRHLKNFMMTRIGTRSEKLGVIMIANKRGAPFEEKDLHFLTLLAGFIATLIESSEAFRRIEEERLAAQRLTKLLVGRELVMKDLKKRLSER